MPRTRCRYFRRSNYCPQVNKLWDIELVPSGWRQVPAHIGRTRRICDDVRRRMNDWRVRDKQRNVLGVVQWIRRAVDRNKVAEFGSQIWPHHHQFDWNRWQRNTSDVSGGVADRELLDRLRVWRGRTIGVHVWRISRSWPQYFWWGRLNDECCHRRRFRSEFEFGRLWDAGKFWTVGPRRPRRLLSCRLLDLGPLGSRGRFLVQRQTSRFGWKWILSWSERERVQDVSGGTTRLRFDTAFKRHVERLRPVHRRRFGEDCRSWGWRLQRIRRQLGWQVSAVSHKRRWWTTRMHLRRGWAAKRWRWPHRNVVKLSPGKWRGRGA